MKSVRQRLILPLYLVLLSLAVVWGCKASSSDQSSVVLPSWDADPETVCLLDEVTQLQIVSIAESLDNDPRLLFEYVRNNFLFEPLYGLRKGPWLTVLQRSGTDCEQAALLVALLRAAGYEARYAVGDILVPLDAESLEYWTNLAANWIGVDSKTDVVLRTLNRGGIPTETARLEGKSYIAVGHVWVKAYIDGAWQNLFPAFKNYSHTPARDIGEIIKFDLETFIAGIEDGAVITPDFVQNLNTSYMSVALEQYTNTLIQYIQEHMPHSSGDALTGKREIIPAEFAADNYPSLVKSEHDELPDEFFYSLRIELAGIDVSVPLFEAARRRVSVFFSGPEHSPELRINGHLVGGGTPFALGAKVPLSLTVHCPNIEDREEETLLIAGGAYVIYTAVGDMGQISREIGDRLFSTSTLPNAAPSSESVLGESLRLMASTYSSQGYGINCELVAPLAEMSILPVCEISIAGQERSYSIDARIGIEISSAFEGTPDAMRTAGATLSGITGSACEHLHIEGLLGGGAISTVSGLGLANRQGQRLFLLNSSNLSDVLPRLKYSHSQKDDWEEEAVRDGATFIVPESPIAVADWIGTAFIREVENRATYSIQGLYGAIPTNARTLAAPPSDARLFLATEPSGIYPPTSMVDTTGSFRYGNTDLQVRGSPPGALGRLRRVYQSSACHNPSSLGYGWDHNYNITATTHSNWSRVLGNSSALEAARLVVASYAALEVLAASAEIPLLKQRLVALLIMDCAFEQLVDNAVTVSFGDGRQWTYIELSDGSYNAPPGVTDELIRNSEGTFTLHRRFGECLEFDKHGRLKCWKDADDNELLLSYNGKGQLEEVVDAAGRTFRFSYQEDLLVGVTDPSGRSVHYEYDDQGNLSSYTDANGGTTKYSYDEKHHLISIVDPTGARILENAFDAKGRVDRQVNSEGQTTQYLYGDLRIVVTDPLGYTTTTEYASSARWVETQDAFGNTRRYDYDASGNIIKERDPLGNTSVYTYDASSNLVEIRDPVGNKTRFEYDDQHRLTKVVDTRGNATQYEYDDQHHLTGIINALGETTRYEYSPTGRVRKVIEPNGAKTVFSYDTYGYLTNVADALGRVTCFSHDNLGRLLVISNPLETAWEFEYDVLGRLVGLRSPTGLTSKLKLDSNGRLEELVDAASRVTYVSSSEAGNLVHLEDPAGHCTSYVYDPTGRLTGISNAHGSTTRYERDALGRITTIVDPLGRRTQLVYSAAGLIIERVDAAGRRTIYERDTLGKITRMERAGEADVVFAYNEAGNLARAESGDWQAEYEYDALDRLIAIKYPRIGSLLLYTYELGGRLLQFELHSHGRLIHQEIYEYDAAGQITCLMDETGSTEFSHDLVGRLEEVRHPNGVIERIEYNDDGKVLSVLHALAVGSTIRKFDYSYDEGGNLVGEAISDGELLRTACFEYDELNQLVREMTSTFEITYTYDEVGNRASIQSGKQITLYTFDATDQLVSANDMEYQYDTSGNLTQMETPEGSVALFYDADNRLVGIEMPGESVVSLEYDPFGRLTQRQSGNQVATYTYSGFNLVAEGTSEGDVDTVHVYVEGRLLHSMRVSAPGPHATFYHLDRLGSVRTATNQLGTAVATPDYTAFGLPIDLSERNISFGHVGGFGVRTEPAVPGLFHMGFRYYYAPLGRFTAKDPLAFISLLGINSYSYALNNPLRFVDPLGLSPALGGAHGLLGEFPSHISILRQTRLLGELPSHTSILRQPSPSTTAPEELSSPQIPNYDALRLRQEQESVVNELAETRQQLREYRSDIGGVLPGKSYHLPAPIQKAVDYIIRNIPGSAASIIVAAVVTGYTGNPALGAKIGLVVGEAVSFAIDPLQYYQDRSLFWPKTIQLSEDL